MLLLALACGSRSLSLKAPLEVGLVAGVDETGVRSATPLLSFEDHAELELSGTNGYLSVSSWTREDLGPLEQLIGDLQPFRAPQGCEPLLPKAAQHVAYDLAGQEIDREAPLLTSPSLDSVCPPARLAFELSYGDLAPACEIPIEQKGCAIDLDLSSCRLGSARAMIDPVGERVCARPTDSCTPDASSGSDDFADLRCRQTSGETVQLTAHSVPAPRFEVVDRVELDDRAHPPNLEGLVQVDVSVLRYGRLLDVAVRDQIVAVSVASGRDDQCFREAGLLVGLDADTLEKSFETPTRCLVQILPTREGFVAATHSANEKFILQLDPRGTVTATLAELGLSGAAELAVEGRTVAFAANILDADTESGIWLGLIDLDSLEVSRVTLSERRNPSVALIGEYVALLDDERDEVVWFSRDLTKEPLSVRLRPMQAAMLSSNLFASGPEALVVTEVDHPAIHLVNHTEDTGRSPFFEGPADAVSLLPLSRTAIVGGVSRYGLRRRGLISEIDLPATKFLLGAADVGEGPVTRLIADGRGGALGLLPWEGSLIRVRRTGGSALE